MKKNIITLWMALLCLTLNNMVSTAQDTIAIKTYDVNNFTEYFDSTHADFIAANPVPINVLYNRVVGWSNLINQSIVENVDKARLKQAWFDLYTSTYNFKNALSYNEFKEKMRQYNLNKHNIPLVSIQYNYAYLDSTIYDSINVALDSLGYPIDSLGNLLAMPKPNLYQIYQAKLTGLYAKEVYEDYSLKFIADEYLLLSNTSNKIKRYEIFDGNEKLLEVSANSSAEYVFSAVGDHLLTIKCHLNNGDILESKQTIKVLPFKKTRAACNNDIHELISSTIPFQGYNETFATTTHADYHVFHKFLNNNTNDCDDKITKPLIFLDGFDPEDSRNYDELYKNFVTTNGTLLPGNVAIDLRRRFMGDYNQISNTFFGIFSEKTGGFPGWPKNSNGKSVPITIGFNGINSNPTINMSRLRTTTLIRQGTWHNWKRIHNLTTMLLSSFNTNNMNTHGCMDASPGGSLDVINSITSEIIIRMNSALDSGDLDAIDPNNFVNPIFSFIPSVSSLGFKNPNFLWNKKFSDRNLLCNVTGSEIPFDNYYAPLQNEEHVNINDANYAWIIQEIEKGKKDVSCPPSICNLALVQPQNICLGNTYSISFTNPLPSGLVISWLTSKGVTVNGGLTTISGNGKITFEVASNVQSPIGTITAEVINPCGSNYSATISFTIKPSISNLDPNDYEIKQFQIFCSRDFQLQPKTGTNAPFFNGVNTYEWSVNNSNWTTSQYNSNSFSLQCVKNTQPIYLRITNPCTGLWGTFYNSFPPIPNTANCQCKMDEEYGEAIVNNKASVYPNPTQDNWRIMLDNFTTIKSVALQLYDLTGKVVWQETKELNNFNTIVVPSAGVVNGIYTLKIVCDNKETSYLKLFKN
jgi:hypothetical protein